MFAWIFSSIFEQLVDSLPFGLYIVDRNKTIQLWNHAAELITGYLRHEAVGRRCSEVLAHCDSNGNACCGSATCPLLESSTDRRPAETRVFSRHKDGYRTAVLVRCLPLRDDNSCVIATAELFQQPRADAADLSWIEGPAYALQGATLPSVAAMEEHVRSTLADTHTCTGLFLIEIDKLSEIVRQRGVEMARAAQRVVLLTLNQVLTVPHDRGRWSRGQFLIMLPDCNEVRFAGIQNKLSKIGSSCAVPWWGDNVPLNISVNGTLVCDEFLANAWLQETVNQAAAFADLGEDRCS